jgi:prepilin-type N-terminal cleavage/methylation domain-containing protein
MTERLMGAKRGEEGVTLIEVLIALVVLGILAAIVAFGISTFRAGSADDACRAAAHRGTVTGCP